MAAALRLVIVDDSNVARDAIAALVNQLPGMTVVGLACDGVQGVTMSRQMRPDVVLMDLNMPVMGGIEATRQVKAEAPSPAVLVVTQFEEEALRQAAKDAGADAVLFKGELSGSLEAAIRGVVAKGMKMSVDSETVKQPFNGVKVFSATMAHDREHLGDKVTGWMRQHADFEVVECRVTQSSDEAFHCIAITVFYRDPTVAARTA